jgi:hypothetical protein
MCLLFLSPSIFYNSNTGFLCLVIYRRDTHVVELQIGNLTSRLEDACAPDQYDVSRTPFTTLLGRMEKHFSRSSSNVTPSTTRRQTKKNRKQKNLRRCLRGLATVKPLNNLLINFHF